MATAGVLLLLQLVVLGLLASARADIKAGKLRPACPPAPGPGIQSAAHRLQHDLFCGYQTNVLPVADVSKNLTVSITFLLHSINVYEYYHESMEVNTWILMSWNDDYLPWDPNIYDGIDFIRPTPEKIWTPVFITAYWMNGGSLTPRRPQEECVVGHRGDVECMWPASFSLECRLQYDLWPFDTQICGFSLISINDNSTSLTLEINNHSLTTWMLENPEWEVEWADVEQRRPSYEVDPLGERMPIVFLKIALRRRAALFLAAFVVPALGLALMTLLPLLLPPSTPQRSLLAATGVLAHFIILQGLAIIIYGPAGTAVPPIVLLFRDSLGLCLVSLVTSVGHRWLVATCPEPPAILRASSAKLLDLWAASLSFVRLQVGEAPAQPGTPAADFWQRWTGAVDGCVLALSLAVYVIVLARFLP